MGEPLLPKELPPCSLIAEECIGVAGVKGVIGPGVQTLRSVHGELEPGGTEAVVLLQFPLLAGIPHGFW